MTEHPDLFAALAAPFDPSEVRVRPQGGRQLHYITARVAMNRLDNVLGPENWWDSYQPGENSVLCILTIRLPNGECLAKADAGGYAGMADSGDDDKSGYSDAFKRACVKFGVARYLYRDGVPSFVSERVPDGELPPVRERPPEGAARRDDREGYESAAPAREREREAPRQSSGGDGPPRSGKGMFAWTKEQEQKHDVGLLKYLNQWAKLQEFPGRMVDWDTDQVNLAYKEAVRKLNSIRSARDGGSSDEPIDN